MNQEFRYAKISDLLLIFVPAILVIAVVFVMASKDDYSSHEKFLQNGLERKDIGHQICYHHFLQNQHKYERFEKFDFKKCLREQGY